MAKSKSTSTKTMWPRGTKKEVITQNLSKAHGNANQSVGNIGDSFESRELRQFLGGPSDMFNGGYGYNGEFLGQSVYDGEESTQRGSHYSSVRSSTQNETKKAWFRSKLANDVYDNDGQVASIVDLMADFATEGVKFIHHQSSVQKFYEAWSQKVRLKQKFRNTIISLLVSGNVFLYRVFARLDSEEERAMKTFTVGQRVGDKLLITSEDGQQTLINPKIVYDSSINILFDSVDEKTLTPDQLHANILEFVKTKLKNNAAKIVDKSITPGEEKVVPWKYIALNSMQIVPEDDGTWTYLLTRDDVKKLLDKADVRFDESASTIKVVMPQGMSGSISRTKRPGFFAELNLLPERLIVLQYNKPDWRKWATGLVWKAMPTVTFKNTLRAMEIKTAKAGINTVILWKLGDHTNNLMPQVEDFERLADMLKAPASTLNVLWSSAITAEVIQPNIKEIYDPKRWEELRKEVTSQFGITQSVVTGEGGNFSSSFISVQGLLEKLETIRDILIDEWLMEEMVIIQKAMGFRKLPRVRFGQMSLRDQVAENNFVMALYDRGLVSDESLYEAVERDADIERERLLTEKKWEESNEFERRGPFIKVPEQDEHDNKQLDMTKKMNDKDMDMRQKELDHSTKLDKQKLDHDMKLKEFESKEKMKIKKVVDVHKAKNPPKINGRPPGSKKPQQKKRPSKPKNLSSRIEAEDLIEKLNDNAKAYLVNKSGVSDYRSLSKEDKLKVMDLVGIAMAEVDEKGAGAVAEPTFMADGMTSTNSEFMATFLKKSQAFFETTQRKPTKGEIYQLYVDSYLES